MTEISTPVNQSFNQENFQANLLQEEGVEEGEQQFISFLKTELNKISRHPSPEVVERVLNYSRSASRA